MDASEAAWAPILERGAAIGADPALAHVGDEEVARRVRDVAAQVAVLTCEWLGWVAELTIRGVWGQQGARTPAAWLSWACGMGLSTAREHVRVAIALRELPLVRARFAAGTLSYSKVRAITRVATPETQELLLALADAAPAGEVERIIAGCRRALTDPGGPNVPVVEPRSWVRVPVDEGTVEFRLRVPVDEAVAFEERLDRLVELVDHDPDGPVARGGMASRRAVAVCDALAMAVAAGHQDGSGTEDHLVVLHVQAADLAEATSASAEAVGPRPRPVVTRRRRMSLPASVLARLACDGQVRVAVVDGAHPGDVGRRRRTIPPGLRRVLQVRDGCCRFPGCGTTRGLHAHHVEHWAAGGRTDASNLVLLCGFHHRFVHDHGWVMTPVDPDAGVWDFAPPGGRPVEPVPGLPGASTEAAAGKLPDPWPDGLQPRWWDGDRYDLGVVVETVTWWLTSEAPHPVPFPPHPATQAA